MVGKMRMVGNLLNIQQTVKFIGYWIFIEYSMNSKVHWILNIDQVGGGQGRRVSLWGDRFHQALLPHPLRKKFLFPSKFQILNKFQLCPKFIRGGKLLSCFWIRIDLHFKPPVHQFWCFGQRPLILNPKSKGEPCIVWRNPKSMRHRHTYLSLLIVAMH